MPTSVKTRSARVSVGIVVSIVGLGLGAMGGGAGCTESKPSASSSAGVPIVPGGGTGAIPTTSNTSTVPTEAGIGADGSTTPLGDPVAICGKVQYGAAGVEEVSETGMSPAASGGTIAAGRYVLSQVLSYVPDGGGPTGYFARKAILFDEGNTFAFLESDGNTTDGVGQSMVTGGTYTIQGTNLVTKLVCPDDTGTGPTYPFSASPSRIALRRGDRWEVYQKK